jgi:hypothetical protein
MKERRKMEYVQQGDCLLLNEKLPKKLKAVAGDLLHKGQNHHHRLKGGAFKIMTDGKTRFVKVSRQTKLVHEEHGAIALPKGEYRLGIVVEYDHHLEESRQVVD